MPVVEYSLWDLERLIRAKAEEILRVIGSRVKGELESVEGDRVRFEATHDRPDHFSAEGVARTVKGLLGIELGSPKYELVESGVEVSWDLIEERPMAVMAAVYGVELDDEAIRQLIQLQEKLHATYGRNRRSVAIGLYDLDRIRPPIRYTRVSPDDEYVPLGFDKSVRIREILERHEKGIAYGSLIRRDAPPALVDSAGQIMVVVPVLGSECCRITESTRNILIDVTGSDVDLLNKVLNVVLYALLERSKARRVGLVKTPIGVFPRLDPIKIEISARQISKYVGVEIGEKRLIELLAMSRIDYIDGTAHVPPYRVSILHWVDVAEDVAIALGYDIIPREPPLQPTRGSPLDIEEVSSLVRKALLTLGLSEYVHYILAPSHLFDVLGMKFVKVLNAVSENYDAVRPAIWPILVLAMNKWGVRKAFELGDVVPGPYTERRVAIAVMGDGITVTDAASIVNALVKTLGVEAKYVNAVLDWFIEGRSALIEACNSTIGAIGEVSPDALTRIGVHVPVAVAELSIDALTRCLRLS